MSQLYVMGVGTSALPGGVTYLGVPYLSHVWRTVRTGLATITLELFEVAILQPLTASSKYAMHPGVLPRTGSRVGSTWSSSSTTEEYSLHLRVALKRIAFLR